MGIKNLNNFLRKKNPSLFHIIPMSDFAYKKIAIDTSLYLYKFKAISKENWIKHLLNMIASLRLHQIHCVFIFDGKSPPAKRQELENRQNARLKLNKRIEELEKAVINYELTGTIDTCLSKLLTKNKQRRLLKKTAIDITWVKQKIEQKKNNYITVIPEDFDNIKKILKSLSIPYYVAPWEAEKMCSKLCKDGLVDAVLSDDTDVIAYGSPILLTKINTWTSTFVQIKIDEIKSSLEFTYPQILDFCIMCGTDYNQNIPKIGPVTSYSYITKYKNIEDIHTNTMIDTKILNYKLVRRLFTQFEDYCISYIPYCAWPNYKQFNKIIKNLFKQDLVLVYKLMEKIKQNLSLTNISLKN